MEPLFASSTHVPPAEAPLRRRVAQWAASADVRLRDAGADRRRGDLATMLRAGVDLVAEELRAEEEARHEQAARAEAALAACRRLLDAVPVALLVTDLDGHVREANELALRLLGLPCAEAATLLVRHVALDERAAFRRTLAAAALDARDAAAVRAPATPARELPLRLRTPDGPRPVVATIRGGPAGSAGEPLLYWAVRDDAQAELGDLL